jgi:hypothetical protein
VTVVQISLVIAVWLVLTYFGGKMRLVQKKRMLKEHLSQFDDFGATYLKWVNDKDLDAKSMTFQLVGEYNLINRMGSMDISGPGVSGSGNILNVLQLGESGFGHRYHTMLQTVMLNYRGQLLYMMNEADKDSSNPMTCIGMGFLQISFIPLRMIGFVIRIEDERIDSWEEHPFPRVIGILTSVAVMLTTAFGKWGELIDAVQKALPNT